MYVYKFSTYALAIAKDTSGGNSGNKGSSGSNGGSASGKEAETPTINATIVTGFNDKEVKAGISGRYATYTVEITEEQAKKITTAVVTEQDGTQCHVPTYVYQQGGKRYATIYYMTDSIVTRAETATTVLRLLQKAGLIDVRTQF